MEIRPMMREDYPAVQALYRELFFEMAAIAPMYIQAADQDVEYLDAVLDSDEDDDAGGLPRGTGALSGVIFRDGGHRPDVHPGGGSGCGISGRGFGQR